VRASVRQTWFSRRAIGLHAVILIIVPTFAGLCDWQVHRALSGNDLSWAYVFEWPFFAGYAFYMWWRILHEVPTPVSPGGEPGLEARPADDAGAASDPEAAERAAYNRYLSELATRGKRKQWR
jgi:hypothetical protein